MLAQSHLKDGRMARLEVDAMDGVKKITVNVHVKNPRQLKIRMWIATRIIKFGAVVGGLSWGGIQEVIEDGNS